LDNVGSLVGRNDFFDELTNSDYKITNFETVKVEKTGTLSFFMNQAVGIIERDHLVGIWGVQRDITAKRLAEKALRDSELRLTSIVQDARLGVWEWQTAEQNIHINQVGLELLEIKETPSSIPLDEFIGWIADEDRTVLETALAKHVINNTDNFQVDIRMTATAGRTPRWLQFHGRLVERGTDGTPLRYSGTILNIHELKIAELLLREGEALLGAVLDAIPDTKLRVDIEGRVLSVYGAATEQTHAMLALPGILGKNLKDLFLVFIAKGLIFNAQKAISSGKLQTFEFLDSRDGVGRYYEARFNRINEREAIIILRDISPIKLFEKELNEQINKYDLKNRQLEKYIESNLQLENFAYVASHDLREPIRTMRSFGQFLDRRIGKTLDEDSRVYLDFIISSADRMNHLIEDLLTYSKVNTEPMTREAIDGQKLLSEVVNSLNTRISETHAEVVMEDIPATIYGSPSRMQQVFQNLIANAIKFHREGVPPRVVVSSSESPTHWAFSIADNGIGIPAEFFEQIFVIFKKLHNHEAYSGTGIGLALVKRIIAQHGGDIWLESKEGEGTTFFFTVLK
jgi:signal transduction histidine kinase